MFSSQLDSNRPGHALVAIAAGVLVATPLAGACDCDKACAGAKTGEAAKVAVSALSDEKAKPQIAWMFGDDEDEGGVVLKVVVEAEDGEEGDVRVYRLGGPEGRELRFERGENMPFGRFLFRGDDDDEAHEFHWVEVEDDGKGPQRRVIRRRLDGPGGNERVFVQRRQRAGLPGPAPRDGGGRWVFEGNDGERIIVIETDGHMPDLDALHRHLQQGIRVPGPQGPHGVPMPGPELHELFEDIHIMKMEDGAGPGPHGMMKLRVGDGPGEGFEIELEGLGEILEKSMGQVHEKLRRELGAERTEEIEKVIRERVHGALREHLGDEGAGNIEKMIRERIHGAMAGRHGGDDEEFEVRVEVLTDDDEHPAAAPEVRRRVERAPRAERDVVIERRGPGDGDRAERLERRIDRLERRIEELIRRLEKMDR